MKYITLFLIVSLFHTSYAQSPSIEWQKSYGGSVNEISRCIKQTNDGGYIVVGESDSNNGDVNGLHSVGVTDFWIVKLESGDDTIWEKCLGGINQESAYAVRQTDDNKYIIGGLSYSNDGDVSGHHGTNVFTDYWVVKLDTDGSIIWQKSLGGTNNDAVHSVCLTNDGGCLVAGYSYSNDGDVTGHHGSTNMPDYWIVKLNDVGSIVWEKSLGGINHEAVRSIQQTSDGGYIVAGQSNSNDGDVFGHHGTTAFPDYWIVKLDGAGDTLWEKSLGGTDTDIATSIQQTTDGGYIVAGWSSSNDGDVTGNHGDVDYWIVKLDAQGSILWEKSVGGINSDEAHSIQQTTDGGYVVSGFSYSNDGDITGNHGGGDYWVIKLNNGGSILWQKSLGGTNDDIAQSMQQTDDGGYIITGYSSSTNGDVSGNHGNKDYWVVKLGCANPDTSVTELGSALQANADNMTYQWLDCDNNYLPVNGATQQTFNPATSSGIYAVIISDGACSDTSNCHIILEVGMNETEKTIKIYPNPVKSVITVNGYSPAYLKLCNTLGQTVAEVSNSNKLYVGNLSQGLYVLQLFDANGQQVKTEKVIVAK